MTTPAARRHWLVCAMTVGPSVTNVRFVGESFVRRITPMLPGIPVALCERDGRLIHPEDDELTACTVGRVVTATFDRRTLNLFATLAITSPRVHHWLVHLERAGRLRKPGLGVSLCFIGVTEDDRGTFPVPYIDARGVRSLDLVAGAASPGAQVLKSVASKENPRGPTC